MFTRRKGERVPTHRDGPVMDCDDCGRVTTLYIEQRITCPRCGAGMRNLRAVGSTLVNPIALLNARRGAALSDDLVVVIAHLSSEAAAAERDDYGRDLRVVAQ